MLKYLMILVLSIVVNAQIHIDATHSEYGLGLNYITNSGFDPYGQSCLADLTLDPATNLIRPSVYAVNSFKAIYNNPSWRDTFNVNHQQETVFHCGMTIPPGVLNSYNDQAWLLLSLTPLTTPLVVGTEDLFINPNDPYTIIFDIGLLYSFYGYNGPSTYGALTNLRGVSPILTNTFIYVQMVLHTPTHVSNYGNSKTLWASDCYVLDIKAPSQYPGPPAVTLPLIDYNEAPIPGLIAGWIN